MLSFLKREKSKQLEDKLNDAKDVLANATTQAEIDEAVKTLREARLSARTKADTSALEALIAEQLNARAEARKAKDFAKADQIRDALTEAGIAIEDGPQGSTWSLK